MGGHRWGRRAAVTEPDLPWTRPLGATPLGGGRVRFRVWAPRARAVAVEVGGVLTELGDAALGTFEGQAAAAPGDAYRLVLDGDRAWPDPCSRAQPEGLRGPSAVVDPGAVRWRDAGWAGLDPEALVLYELHVGTFTPEGTFDAAIVPRLRGLRELGVTAIELMPVATFPGRRGWGYDGLYTSAPHEVYGGPAGLARLVDAAHAEGLGVVLDVVYNHVGPGPEALEAFGPYFTDRHGTFWGRASTTTTPLGRPRVGDPERRHVGPGLPRRRAAAGCGARDLRPRGPPRAGRAGRAGPGGRAGALADRRERSNDPRRSVPRSRGGATTPSGRRLPPRAARAADR